MDANQRSEVNNQTNNGANEKWTPGAKGNTGSGPLDHTYPASGEQHRMVGSETRLEGTNDPAIIGQQETAAEDGGRAEGETSLPHAVPGDLRGGSLQSQQTGGSGPQQGITDSHQRQMEMHSDAWGELEQPVGNRAAGSGTSLRDHPANRQGNTQATEAMNPQNAAQPELQGGSLGRHHGVVPGTGGAEARGTEAGLPGAQQGDIYGNRQNGGIERIEASDGDAGQAGQSADSTDRSGSQTAAGARDAGSHDVHQSNDVAGGLPRSPGGTGPTSENPGYKPGGSMHAEPNPVHESNDAAGGYPRSPGGANKLAGDRKMDDDTGFSRG